MTQDWLEPFLQFDKNRHDSEINRRKLVTKRLVELTYLHKNSCEEYARMIKAFRADFDSVQNIPFIPSRLFKMMDLISVPQEQIMKRLTSSGTGSTGLTRIHLDAVNAREQSKALTKIVSGVLGSPDRRPMLVIDSPLAVGKTKGFNARAAGIRGFSLFGRPVMFGLKDDMTINDDVLRDFMGLSAKQPCIVFGFTSIMWMHFLAGLLDSNYQFPDTSRTHIIHGGGWKKMADSAVDPKTFAQSISSVFGRGSLVHEYYGMVEQTGSVFFACAEGNFHSNVFNEVVVRSPLDLSVCKHEEIGLLQVFSVLPTSYPGHSILTEDLGFSLKSCACGEIGSVFRVIGRAPNSEIRGCGNTYEGPTHVTS